MLQGQYQKGTYVYIGRGDDTVACGCGTIPPIFGYFDGTRTLNNKYVYLTTGEYYAFMLKNDITVNAAGTLDILFPDNTVWNYSNYRYSVPELTITKSGFSAYTTKKSTVSRGLTSCYIIQYTTQMETITVTSGTVITESTSTFTTTDSNGAPSPCIEIVTVVPTNEPTPTNQLAPTI